MLSEKYRSSLAKSALNSQVVGAYGPWNCDHLSASEQKGKVSVIWNLENLEIESQYGDSLYLKTTLNETGGISYQIYGPESPRPLSSGMLPEILNGDFDHDLEKYLSSVDAIIQMVEDLDFSSQSILTRLLQQFDRQEPQYKSEKPEKVPLSQAFSKKEEPNIPEEPAQPPPKKDWRQATDDNELIRLFPRRPKADDVLDLHAIAQQKASNKLMNFAKQASQRVESVIDEKAKNLVDSIMARVRQQSGIAQLESLLATQTKPVRKQYLEGLLTKAKAVNLVEGKKQRVILFKPCNECHQEEGKIEECKRCKGCGIDPEFQVRIFEDPRNPIHEILPVRRLPSRPG